MTKASIDPTREQFKAFMTAPQDTPIHMLNLIRLRDVADYPADHPNHGNILEMVRHKRQGHERHIGKSKHRQK